MQVSRTPLIAARFCMRNARTAHALAHWKYHLNEWVVDYLTQESHLDASKVVERDRWSVKRKCKYANEVTDQMETSGEIQSLYRDFKDEIEQAQNSGGVSLSHFRSVPKSGCSCPN